LKGSFARATIRHSRTLPVRSTRFRSARSKRICGRYTAARGRPRLGVCYFFPRPSAGSACKRLNLFLRWMVRRDAIDLGVWTTISPLRLVVPSTRTSFALAGA
jgi:hypothetical protein